MLAGMTTPVIVPMHPIRQLSGSIIPEKRVVTGASRQSLSVSPALYSFGQAYEIAIQQTLIGFLPMEDDNV